MNSFFHPFRIALALIFLSSQSFALNYQKTKKQLYEDLNNAKEERDASFHEADREAKKRLAIENERPADRSYREEDDQTSAVQYTDGPEITPETLNSSASEQKPDVTQVKQEEQNKKPEEAASPIAEGKPEQVEVESSDVDRIALPQDKKKSLENELHAANEPGEEDAALDDSQEATSKSKSKLKSKKSKKSVAKNKLKKSKKDPKEFKVVLKSSKSGSKVSKRSSSSRMPASISKK